MPLIVSKYLFSGKVTKNLSTIQDNILKKYKLYIHENSQNINIIILNRFDWQPNFQDS